jgi:hypothetical protein
LAEYVKILINYFYSIMVRNLRESIPKATGQYFIKSLKQNTRFFLLTELAKEISHLYDEYLKEDPEVMRKRNYYIDLLKVLRSCDKVLMYDDE